MNDEYWQLLKKRHVGLGGNSYFVEMYIAWAMAYESSATVAKVRATEIVRRDRVTAPTYRWKKVKEADSNETRLDVLRSMLMDGHAFYRGKKVSTREEARRIFMARYRWRRRK